MTLSVIYVTHNPKVKNQNFQLALVMAFLSAMTLTWSGCSTPTGDTVQPPGKPGLVQGGIPVEIIQDPVTVEAVDLTRRTITLKRDDGTVKTFTADESVDNLNRVKVGDRIKAAVKAELSVYILDHDRLPNADGTFRPRTVNFNATVTRVYLKDRLLVLQFTNGHTMTIKAGPDVMLERMSPGDDAVMRSSVVTAITIKQS